MESFAAKPSSRLLPFFAWAMSFWCALGAVVYGLKHNLIQHPEWWGLIFGAMMLTVPCGAGALRASGASGRLFRVIFWMISLAGIAVVALAFDGQREALQRESFGTWLMRVSIALPLLVAIWLGIRPRLRGRGESKRVDLSDCALGAVCLAIVAGTPYVVIDKVSVPNAVRNAQREWADIGRPMPEFEKQLKKVEENASLRELVRDLEPLGIKSFYRSRPDEKDPNSFGMTQGVLAVFNQVMEKGDRIVLPGSVQQSEMEEGSRFFADHAKDFESLYEGALHRESPVWECRLGDELSQKVPNYQVARTLAQIITTDACLKLQRGDTQGAATAFAASARIFKKFNESPLLVTYMVQAAIEGLLYGGLAVRLPDDPQDLKALASEVDFRRERFLRVLQMDALSMLREVANQKIDDYQESQLASHLLREFPLRKSIVKWVSRPLIRWEAAKGAYLLAREVQICSRARELASTDMGASELNRAYQDTPYLSGPNIVRAVLRTNFSLLLREQTGIIRAARAQMVAGKSGSLGEWASCIVPGSKWIATGDSASNSVALKLSPMPPWVADKSVADDTFWPASPDGSRSWKFAPAL